jgi:hypothetical protein
MELLLLWIACDDGRIRRRYSFADLCPGTRMEEPLS